MPGPVKKRKVQPSDFKKRKAKVGKRALRPANLTDTSFKTATLTVRNQQSVDRDSTTDSSVVVSSRGRSISELVVQLHHPAAAARISALKGLGNIVSSNFQILEHHVATILPPVTKCSCLDEDSDVRQVAQGILRSILTLGTSLQPFLPLLVAYVTSALHSLDQSTRLDGAQVVELLSQSRLCMSNQQYSLLPAYVGLLTDFQSQRKGTDSRILPSLVSLLSVKSAMNESDGLSKASRKPHLQVLPGGRSRSALVLAGRSVKSRRTLIQDWNHLDETKTDAEEIDAKTLCDLVVKMRDIAIEATQKGLTSNLSESTMMVKSLRLLWEHRCKTWVGTSTATCHQEHVDKLRRLFRQLVTLFLDSFPLLDSNMEKGCDSLNAEISMFSMNVGSVVSEQEIWVEKVLDYLLSRLGRNSLKESTQVSLLHVYGSLLLLEHEGKPVIAGETRETMLETLHSSFFDDLSPVIAVLPIARRATLLLGSLLDKCDYNLSNEGSFASSFLIKMLLKLPSYLMVWRDSFPTECEKAVSILHSVVRRIPREEKDNEVCLGLRGSLARLFTAEKKTKRRGLGVPSFFEISPPSVQRQMLGLLVMTQSPTEEALDALADISASSAVERATIGPEMADAIVESVHCIRRSISRHAYVSFLVKKSTGMTWLALIEVKGCAADPQEEIARLQASEIKLILKFDGCIRRSCGWFAQCGSSKMLSTLQPLLSDWLAASLAVTRTASTFAQTRAAVSILSFLLLDMRVTNASSSLYEAWSALEEIFCTATSSIFKQIPSQIEGDAYLALIRPFAVLVANEKRLLCSLVRRISEDITTMETSEQTGTLRVMQALVNHINLAESSRAVLGDLARYADLVEKATRSGPAEVLGRRLRASIDFTRCQVFPDMETSEGGADVTNERCD